MIFTVERFNSICLVNILFFLSLLTIIVGWSTIWDGWSERGCRGWRCSWWSQRPTYCSGDLCSWSLYSITPCSVVPWATRSRWSAHVFHLLLPDCEVSFNLVIAYLLISQQHPCYSNLQCRFFITGWYYVCLANDIYLA